MAAHLFFLADFFVSRSECDVPSRQNGVVVSVQNKPSQGFRDYPLIAECASFSKMPRKVRLKQQPALYRIAGHGRFPFFLGKWSICVLDVNNARTIPHCLYGEEFCLIYGHENIHRAHEYRFHTNKLPIAAFCSYGRQASLSAEI